MKKRKIIFTILLSALTSLLIGGCSSSESDIVTESTSDIYSQKPIITTPKVPDNGEIYEEDEELPEFYTTDPENEMYLGNGMFVKKADYERTDPFGNKSEGRFLIPDMIFASNYSPYSSNSVENPDDFSDNKTEALHNHIYMSKGDGRTIVLRKGDKLGNKGLVVDECYMYVEPITFESKKLGQTIGTGIKIWDEKLVLKGDFSLSGILVLDKNSDFEEMGGAPPIYFFPDGNEFYDIVPLFAGNDRLKFQPCVTFNDEDGSEPAFAVSSGIPISFSTDQNLDWLPHDAFDSIYYKRATISFSDLTYYDTDRGPQGYITGTVTSLDEIKDIEREGS